MKKLRKWWRKVLSWIKARPLWVWMATAGVTLSIFIAAVLGGRKTRKPTQTTDAASVLNDVTNDVLTQGTAQIAASNQRIKALQDAQAQDDAAQARAAQQTGSDHAKIDNARSGADVDVVLYGRKL